MHKGPAATLEIARNIVQPPVLTGSSGDNAASMTGKSTDNLEISQDRVASTADNEDKARANIAAQVADTAAKLDDGGL